MEYLIKISGIAILVTILMTTVRADIDLDNKKLIKKIYPTYTADKANNELDITLHDVGVECRAGVRPAGPRLGNYPNPDYQPFEKALESNGQSPHCVVYYKRNPQPFTDNVNIREIYQTSTNES